MRYLLLSLFSFIGYLSFASGWIQMADFGGSARHRTPMLSIGNKIYAGQGHYNGGGVNTLFEDWWEYDPASNTWTQKADYGGGIVYHAAGFVIGDYGYVGTGRVTASGNTLTKDFFRYDPQTNTWTQLADYAGAPRRGAVAFAIDGFGYLGTGEPQSGGSMYNDFFRYDPGTDTWTAVAPMPTLGRVSGVGFELGGYGYVGTGGLGSWSNSQNDFWRYDPNTNQWTQMANVGSIPRMESSGFGLNGKGYILTGDNMSSGTNYSDMYEYDPATNSWTQLEDFPGSSRRYMASVAHNGLAYCGLGTSGVNYKDFWMFDQTLSLIDRGEISVEMNIYPNPACEQITFEISGIESIQSEDFKLFVHDLSGNLVYERIVTDKTNTVDLTNLSGGMYIYKLMYKDRLLKDGKIVRN